MEIKSIVFGQTVTGSIGVNDVVKDNVLHKSIPVNVVLVTAEADLADLPEYPTGTIAYTTGFQAMWQLGADGEWVSVI